MYSLIVARYAESLDWVLQVPSAFDVIVVNKGKPITDERILRRLSKVLSTQNRGREASGYIQAILNQRESGREPELTVFTQANPFDHSPDFLHALAITDSWMERQPLSTVRSMRHLGKGCSSTSCEANLLANQIRVGLEYYSLMSWAPLHFFDPGAFRIGSAYRAMHNLQMGANVASHFLTLIGMQALSEKAKAASIGAFSYGAIFGVTARNLRTVESAILVRLQHLVEEEVLYGYVIERLWLHILGEPFRMLSPSTDPALASSEGS